MESVKFILFLICATLLVDGSLQSQSNRRLVTSDELENNVSQEDLREFFEMYQKNATKAYAPDTDLDSADIQYPNVRQSIPDLVDCFGLGSVSRSMLKFFNMKPDGAEKVNTHFYFSSRENPQRVQVFPGEQFGLEWVDFKPTRKTVMIVHGFMSDSNVSWVSDMTNAFLQWGDVNVFAVDWSGGGNTWKYWRAVANTRTVGSDVTRFFKQLIRATGANVKDFHFVGHSLGAHIASFASHHLGGVARITGLDPAQPCFATSNDVERLDPSDADYVDIIHTNGRMLKKIGFGMPEPMGHADFYPNGGLKQPGCTNSSSSMWSRMVANTKLQQAVCSHGRAYALFTESLINNDCSFRAYRWDLTYEGVNASLNSRCNKRDSCAEMGIRAAGGEGVKRARGSFLLMTSDKESFCVRDNAPRPPLAELMNDLRQSRSMQTTTVKSGALAYADPELYDESTYRPIVTTTTQKSWWSKFFG